VAGTLVDEFTATVWRYDGSAAWYFLTLPLELADEIRSRVEPVGFGSVRVRARIGATAWSTSVFPDKHSGSFVLPVKAAVRRAEDLDDGSPAYVHLAVEV
jgi:hypothetical protein